MSMDFSVLASGSSGNASLVRWHNFGILLDLGLGPRQLARRLEAAGSGWHHVRAALLSHTHGDHWRERTLRELCERRIPLYCHAAHQQELTPVSPAMKDLRENGLVRLYDCGAEFRLELGVRIRALPLSHDAGVTCGFRIEADGAALGYVSDLGTWQHTLAESLANVDILAVEFNHDVHLEQTSRRAPALIARVLGDAGHLSNDQAAELVGAVLALSEPGRLRHLVQLHLSRQCNRIPLARAAAVRLLADLGLHLAVHTARQHRPGPLLRLGESTRRKIRQPALHFQPLLPGWE